MGRLCLRPAVCSAARLDSISFAPTRSRVRAVKACSHTRTSFFRTIAKDAPGVPPRRRVLLSGPRTPLQNQTIVDPTGPLPTHLQRWTGQFTYAVLRQRVLPHLNRQLYSRFRAGAADGVAAGYVAAIRQCDLKRSPGESCASTSAPASNILRRPLLISAHPFPSRHDPPVHARIGPPLSSCLADLAD
jgi:hypothetical protein